jgi:hypothetical protein
MLKDLLNPIKTIEESKKTKNATNQILTLILASILLALSALIIIIPTQIPFSLFQLTAIIILGYFILMIISATAYYLVIKIISKKGIFQNSLTAVAQSSIIFSAGTFLTAIVLLIPELGYLLGLIILFTALLMSFAIFIRALTITTGASITEVLIATLIIMVSLIIATQLIISIQMLMEPMSFAQNIPVEEIMIDAI